jgi:alpha-glucosidase
VTNFGDTAVDLPAGTVLVSSAPLEGGKLPANTTAWLR